MKNLENKVNLINEKTEEKAELKQSLADFVKFLDTITIEEAEQ